MRLSRQNARKKASTLVELSIVMAMVAIIGTMVASFCALTSARSRQITTDSQVREALCNVEQALDRWVAAHDTNTTTISVSSGGHALQASDLAAADAPADPLTRAGIPADCVDTLTFAFVDSETSGSDRPLTVRCTVSYTRPAVGNTPATPQTLVLYKTFHAAKGEKP